MKKLTRILALALALMMALVCCAAAETAPETDTTIYSLSIFDPIVCQNGEPVIDLTGATLDLNFAATDTGLLGLIVNLFAGENIEYVCGATAQLDPTGVTAWLDGMSNTYNVDISALTGVNPYYFMAALPLRTALNSAELTQTESVAFTPEMRVAMAAQLFTAVADESGKLSISAEQGRALLLSLGEYIAQVDADTAQEYMDSLNEDPATAFTLEGAMTYDGQSIAIEASGSLIDSTASFPFTVKYSDNQSEIVVDAALQDDAGETIATLSGESVTGPDENGLTATNALFILDLDGEAVHFGYTALPVAGAAEVDHTFSVAVPSAETSVDFMLQTGIHPEGFGFNAGVFAYQGEEYYGFGLQFAGDNMVAANGTPYKSSYLYTYVDENDDRYSLELGMIMQAFDENTAAWALPTEGSVNVLTMDEAQMQTAMDEIMTVVQNAMPALTEGIPGLAALMGAAPEMPAETAAE